jgi:hypothetical protein
VQAISHPIVSKYFVDATPMLSYETSKEKNIFSRHLNYSFLSQKIPRPIQYKPLLGSFFNISNR